MRPAFSNLRYACTLLFCLVAAPGTAFAHVTSTVTQARPGERIEVALTIGHGCLGKATTALRVAVPQGLEDVQPTARAGWRDTVSDSEFGWSGGELPDRHTEEFIFTARVSGDAAGRITIPVVQVCGDTTLRWIDRAAGADNPAPQIEILPAR